MTISSSYEITLVDQVLTPGSIKKVPIKSDSILNNLLVLLMAHFKGAAPPNQVKNLAAQLVYPIPDPSTFYSIVPAGDQLSGIVIGIGNTPVTLADYKLANQVNHGSLPGEILYGPNTLIPLTYYPFVTFFSVSRTFLNDSGGDITINEIAFYAIFRSTVLPVDYLCIIRDLCAPTIVQHTKTLSVTYNIQIGL